MDAVAADRLAASLAEGRVAIVTGSGQNIGAAIARRLAEAGVREVSHALRAIAEIVHDIDLKDDKFGRAEVAGIRTLLEGVSVATKDDSARIARGTEVFNNLYEFFKKKRR